MSSKSIRVSRTRAFAVLVSVLVMFSACQDDNSHVNEWTTPRVYGQGSFKYDLDFLRQHDSVILLRDTLTGAGLIVSPRYQGKVFTSTAQGDSGTSFGWINYKAFTAAVDSHMNAYGGENRLWLGPEGGKFSLFFPKGRSMTFQNWKTPAPFDTESWKVSEKDDRSVTLHKEMKLDNYAGSSLSLAVDRTIAILGRPTIDSLLSLHDDTAVRAVGYQTTNALMNTGDQEWNAATGMPCIWILDMFRPSPYAVILIPYRNPGKRGGKVTNTEYFGKIAPGRLIQSDSSILFRADGKSRGKIGVTPGAAKPLAGSYDEANKVLTLILFDTVPRGKYLNQEWAPDKPPFSGDAVNAYNDGPLADGSQMGPFYELESVSPAAMLKPKQVLVHRHAVFHFSGSEAKLNEISLRTLGIPLGKVSAVLPGS